MRTAATVERDLEIISKKALKAYDRLFPTNMKHIRLNTEEIRLPRKKKKKLKRAIRESNLNWSIFKMLGKFLITALTGFKYYIDYKKNYGEENI